MDAFITGSMETEHFTRKPININGFQWISSEEGSMEAYV